MSFVAFGNPLTDMTVIIENDDILKKYGLEDDFQAEFELEKFEALYKEVKPRFQDHPDMSVGRTICMVRGNNRCLVANIGSAGHFSLDYLKQTEELQEMLSEATIIHVEGFFLSNRFPVCRYLVEEVGKTLSYSLAAPYVIKELGQESRTLGSIYGLETAEDCALRLHDLWMKKEKGPDDSYIASLGKIVVVTNNCNPVLVVWGSSQPATVKRFEVPELDPELIVDTTGAGDAFLAGFVYGLMKSRPVEVCVRFGCRIAATVIGYHGVLPPDGGKLPSLEECD